LKQAIKILATIVEDDEGFEERMDAYVKAGGEVPKDFLEHLEQARDIWQEIEGGNMPEEIAELSAFFQEAIVELLMGKEKGKALVDLQQKTSDKSVTKAIRKALHILRKKGVDIPEPDSKQPAARVVKTEPQRPLSIVTIPLSDGSQEIFLISKSGREFNIISAITYYGEGIRDYGTFAAGKAAIRSLKEKLDGLGRAPVEIPYETAYALLERALKWHDERGTAPPQGFISNLRRWEKPKAKEQTDAPPEIEGWEDAIADSTELLEHPPFDRWSLPWEEERKFEHKINEIYTSQIIPSEERKIELIKERIDQTVDEFFGERREFFAGVLRQAAELLRASGKPELEKLSLAISHALEKSSLPPSRIPFLRAIISRRLLFQTPEGSKSFHEMENEPKNKEDGETTEGSESSGGIIIPG